MALKRVKSDLKMENTFEKVEITTLLGEKGLRSFLGTQEKIIFLLIESITERIYGPYMPLGQNV